MARDGSGARRRFPEQAPGALGHARRQGRRGQHHLHQRVEPEPRPRGRLPGGVQLVGARARRRWAGIARRARRNPPAARTRSARTGSRSASRPRSTAAPRRPSNSRATQRRSRSASLARTRTNGTFCSRGKRAASWPASTTRAAPTTRSRPACAMRSRNPLRWAPAPAGARWSSGTKRPTSQANRAPRCASSRTSGNLFSEASWRSLRHKDHGKTTYTSVHRLAVDNLDGLRAPLARCRVPANSIVVADLSLGGDGSVEAVERPLRLEDEGGLELRREGAFTWRIQLHQRRKIR